jgi:hypothetical protein
MGIDSAHSAEHQQIKYDDTWIQDDAAEHSEGVVIKDVGESVMNSSHW